MLGLFRLAHGNSYISIAPAMNFGKLDWGGGAFDAPPPLSFLNTIKDLDMKLTPLIKRREINLLLLTYLSCDVT